MRKLIVFDLDGTLLDTLSDLAETCNYLLRVLGFPMHEKEAYRHFVGDGIKVLMRRILPEEYREDEAVRTKAGELFATHYAAHAQDSTAPYPGVIDMLDALEERGIASAVYSNKPHVNVGPLVRHYFGRRIALAFGKREGYAPKPDTATVKEILERFGAAPAQCLYAGDSGVDMRTARAAGIYAIGVSWGFRTKEELLEQGADVIIDKPEEILKIAIDF
ncbi:HAD family hydrolase [Bacteroides sp. OttesenSCG-928-J23]|nr:HAD family hydrolase [Bacteroides sp. OttesenSCG-928-J23]